ncbi:hypothetical protein DFJ67_5870 [Asanoa ferruginea]|uniref:Uncharacterized protein n=1 Tax=Asanoa ferruginea TaxID=53367 RepID=A0A3D9ZR22_9ACTN|nr:hypothetical protein [Asanoa ferruginea]REF99826.1 hypothetical protein DFJ67_5870 [Asanoa ferruginea]GIF51844.1 hypothetical protein Afe04nite_63830 [Asanoa ferruginea]
MLDPVAFVQAVNATRDHVYSARPDAPVVPDRTRRSGRGDPLRRSTATILRRLANRVEPRRAKPCSTATA